VTTSAIASCSASIHRRTSQSARGEGRVWRADGSSGSRNCLRGHQRPEGLHLTLHDTLLNLFWTVEKQAAYRSVRPACPSRATWLTASPPLSAQYRPVFGATQLSSLPATARYFTPAAAQGLCPLPPWSVIVRAVMPRRGGVGHSRWASSPRSSHGHSHEAVRP